MSAKTEIAGLDIPEMGAMGYPETTPKVLPENITDEQVEAAKAGRMLGHRAAQVPESSGDVLAGPGKASLLAISIGPPAPHPGRRAFLAERAAGDLRAVHVKSL